MTVVQHSLNQMQIILRPNHSKITRLSNLNSSGL
jgi:hypothetical protein